MTAPAYASRGDVYRYGLPRGALGNPGRLVASALAATDTIELFEHGFQSGDALTVRVPEGGVLPVPLVAGTIYYALRLNDSEFQVSAAPLGSAINLTTDGVSVIVTADLPFDDVLQYYSRFVDDMLPAHSVPLTTPYPIMVVATVAELAAKKLQILSGLISESMRETELSAKAKIERWAVGLVSREAQANKVIPTNLAITKAIRHERIGIPVSIDLGGDDLVGNDR
jgi:hypothetical protein